MESATAIVVVDVEGRINEIEEKGKRKRKDETRTRGDAISIADHPCTDPVSYIYLSLSLEGSERDRVFLSLVISERSCQMPRPNKRRACKPSLDLPRFMSISIVYRHRHILARRFASHILSFSRAYMRARMRRALVPHNTLYFSPFLFYIYVYYTPGLFFASLRLRASKRVSAAFSVIRA